MPKVTPMKLNFRAAILQISMCGPDSCTPDPEISTSQTHPDPVIEVAMFKTQVILDASLNGQKSGIVVTRLLPNIEDKMLPSHYPPQIDPLAP